MSAQKTQLLLKFELFNQEIQSNSNRMVAKQIMKSDP